MDFEKIIRKHLWCDIYDGGSLCDVEVAASAIRKELCEMLDGMTAEGTKFVQDGYDEGIGYYTHSIIEKAYN